MSDTLNEQSHGSKLLNASKVNAFILKKEWEALDDYLVKFVARVLKKTQDEVVMLHPGLFFIPRMERLLDMLTNLKFEEASSFFKSSIELLQGCQGTSVALDLIHNIEELNAGVEKKSWPVKRDSAHEIGTSITDYMHVCFPSAILRDDGASEGLWQFAMRLPKPEKQGQDKGKLYYPFRCFLCGWVTKGKHSLSHLRKHLIHQSKDIKMCYKVTEDVLARLMAMDEANVPAFEFLKDKFSKVRKPNLVSWADPTVSVKRPRDNTSGSLDTLPAQLKHPRLKLFEQSPTTFKSSEEAERAACSLSSQPKQSTFPAVDILPGQLKHPHLKLSEQSPSTTFKSTEEAERAACSLSLSQQKHSTFPAATVPDKVTEPTGPVWVLVCKLNEETDAINSRINPSIIPSLDDILSVREIYLAFQEEVLLLRQYARTHDQRSDSEELSELVRSVLFGAKAFVRSLTADVVPVKEDRLFFITSVSKVMEMLMEI